MAITSSPPFLAVGPPPVGRGGDRSLDQSAYDKRKSRFGVAFRLLGALLAITSFAIATSVIALYTFDKYGAGFDRIASSNLPALVAASNLAQRSQELAANAPNLAAADGHFARRALIESLRGQLRGIAESGEQLKAFAPATEGLSSLMRDQVLLKENLEKLDRMDAEKIEADRVTANLMLRLGALSARIHAASRTQLSQTKAANVSREQTEALGGWTGAADQAIVIMLSTSTADTTVRLDRLRSEFEEVLIRTQTALSQLPQVFVEAVAPWEQTLTQYGRGSPNIFDARKMQLASTSAVRGALLENKEISAALVASAKQIFVDVQNDARTQSNYFAELVAEYARLFTIIPLLCVVGACGVFVYVNRSIIRRLKKLSEVMRASVGGRTENISIPGNDEIADMSRAAEFFVTTIEQREKKLNDSLQQQTATADVLKVISRSTFDLQTVLDTLTESAARLCNADMAAIARQGEAGNFYHVTNYNFPLDWVEFTRTTPLGPGRGGIVGRVLLERKSVQITDVLADPEYAFPEMQRMAGYRSLLGVPLMRSGQPIGVLFLGRREVEPFSDDQVDLVSTFADQAVIAIENVRLFEEVQARTEDLAESLQQQTATADVLKVISRSTFDLQAVLDTLVESVTRLCEADHAWLFQREGDHFRFAASFGHGTEVHSRIRDYFLPREVPIDRGSITGRSALEARVVHVPDVLADSEYTWNEAQKIGGYRAALGAPLLRDRKVVGVIFVAKTVPQPFTTKQIELVSTFADQAVIAIENVRLFDEVRTRTSELSQSVDELRALGEVSQAVNSTVNLETVLNTIVAKATQLSGTDAGAIYVFDQAAQEFHLRATYGMDDAIIAEIKDRRIHIGETAIGEAVEQRISIQIPDIQNDPNTPVLDVIVRAGFRALLIVPLLAADRTVGALVVRRKRLGEFPKHTVDLLQALAVRQLID
jgi:GAF domain-containing protein